MRKSKSFVILTSKTMVLQTTTRGVGRVQKIQNGTILEQIEKNSEKTSLVSKYSKQDKTKCSNIALQQNGEKKVKASNKKTETTFKTNYVSQNNLI